MFIAYLPVRAETERIPDKPRYAGQPLPGRNLPGGEVAFPVGRAGTGLPACCVLWGVELAAGWLLKVTSEVSGMFAKPSLLSKSVVV